MPVGDPCKAGRGIHGRARVEDRLETPAPRSAAQLSDADRVQPRVGALDPLERAGLHGSEQRILQGVLRHVLAARDGDEPAQHASVARGHLALEAVTVQRSSSL